MTTEAETCFANSKHLEFVLNGKVLGFVIADVLLRELIKRHEPPGNPIIQQLLHDYTREPVYVGELITESHEMECLEYVLQHIKWRHIEWHFQATHRTGYGILKDALGTSRLVLRFADEQFPDKLYKYTATKNVQHFINSNSIYLAKPTQFNDPFDCPFNGKIWEKMKKIGISCFSAKNDNSLMFSHYADEHRGACLVFDPQHFNDLSNRWNENVGGRIQQVIYYDKFPRFDEKREPARIVTAKHRDWSYEREYRLTTNWAYPSGIYTFNPQALRGVIFGVRMPEEEKEAIYRLAVDNGRTLEYFQAVKKPNSYSLTVKQVQFHRRKLIWK
jgi:hypothetical protein